MVWISVCYAQFVGEAIGSQRTCLELWLTLESFDETNGILGTLQVFGSILKMINLREHEFWFQNMTLIVEIGPLFNFFKAII